MMLQNSNPSFKEKYNFVLQHKGTLPAQQQKYINDLAGYQHVEQEWKEAHPSKSADFANAVKLQTLYKCCMPAIYSVEWEQQINYKTAMPLTGIVAFLEPGEQYYSVDQKFATWVESGGTRVTPVKTNIAKDKLVFTLSNVLSALVIPQTKVEHCLQFFEMLAEVLGQCKELPVLAIGNSALILMGIINKNQELKGSVNLSAKFITTGDAMVYATHCDPFFSNLNLKTRLQLENKFKMPQTNGILRVQNVLKQNNETIKILAVAKDKSENWNVMLARQQLVHYSFFAPKLDPLNMQALTFAHKVIINFTEEIRKRSKPKGQVAIELGHFKMMLKNDRYHYNCDNKLPKV